ncbi:MAG TPA: hypothetical protein VE078_19150, partial [Thermoanaerobaculia bacterium]|nr:hypothetical protein [Thermoanaerobaculia bacterium]
MSPPERFNPFPGLRSFEPDEDHLFFGREAQTDELLRRLRTTRFLAVVGTSGSGKSSLVRSGLIPALYGGAMSGAGSAWRVAILRPGGNPIGNLADALATPGALGDAPVRPDRSFLEANLRASRLGLVESVREAGLPRGDRLLILADQFEELFRFRQSGHEARDEALAFVRLLLEAARHEAVPVYVALTTRSEYIGHCMEFPDLPEAINDGLYLVPRMTREQLRSAITGPVAVGGGQIALRLVHRLLNDVGDNPDQLPVLQHALMRTWDWWISNHAKGEPLDLRHYEAVGTLRGALSLHADEAFGELDTRGKAIAETMFKALTDLGPGGQGVRRPAALREVCALAGAEDADVVAVVERFRQPRRSFLTPPAGTALNAASILDLSHESLMRVWDKLRGWVKEEARAGREYRDLAGDADRYAREKADLLRGLDLQVALAWRERVRPNPVWALRYDPAFLWATSFLDESEAAQQQAMAEQDRQRQTRQRLVWSLVAVCVLAAFVFLGLWQNARAHRLKAERAWDEAVVQKRAADSARLEAEVRKTEAERARLDAENRKTEAEQARQTAEERKADADAARLEALAQKSSADAARLEAEGRKSEAERARLDAENRKTEAELARKTAEERKVEAEQARLEAESSQGQAVEQKAKAERLKSLAEARALAVRSLRLQEDQKKLTLAALLAVQAYRVHRENRDGYEDESKGYADETDFYRALHSVWKRLPAQATPPAGGRGAKKTSDAGPSAEFRPQDLELKVPVRGVSFGGAGKTLVVGSEDGFVSSYPLPRGEKKDVRVLRQFKSGVRSLALGPSREVFAAGSLGGSLVAWKGPATSLDVTPGPVTALAFQRKGPLLAAGKADGGVELWDWMKGKARHQPTLKAAGFAVASLALSDRDALAAAGKSGILYWKDLQTADPIQLHPGPDVWALDLR